MRHRIAGIKLSRTASHRKAMFRNMVTSLFKYDQIRTTEAKAKEVRRWADQLVSLAKRGDLHARRQAMAIIQEKDVVHKLFEEAPQRFADVNGGYTRIVKVGFRPGDAAAVSLVQLISPEPKKKKKPRRKKKETPAVETAPAALTETAAAESEAASQVSETEGTADVEAQEPQAETTEETVETRSEETAAPAPAAEATTEEPEDGSEKKEI